MELRWTAVSGTAHDDVWVAGAGGDVRRFDGRAWVPRRLDERFTPQILWAAEHGAVWVGGHTGHANRGPALWHVRADGAEPSTCPEAPEVAVTCLWGSSPGDLWAGTLGGELLHGDGRSWKLVTKLGGPVRTLAGCGPTELFACVETSRDAAAASEVWRWDGSAWRRDAELPAHTLRHALSLGAHGLWAIARPVVGGRATLASYRSDKGLRFVSTPYATDDGGPDADALAVCGREGERRAYVASSEDLWCWDGEAWSRERLDTDTDLVGARSDARGERYFAGPYWVTGLWLDGAGTGFAVANRMCNAEVSTGEWYEGGVFRRREDGLWRPEVLGDP